MPRVECQKPGCEKSWASDPVYTVECPQCGAEPGKKCKRPSGHTAWGGWHDARDIAASKAGAYGVCPLGLCGLKPAGRATQKPIDGLPLFDPSVRGQLDLEDAIAATEGGAKR